MIIVRAAASSDLPELSRLWHEKMVLQQQADSRLVLMQKARTKWTESAAQWLTDKRCCFQLAEDEGLLLGYIVGWLQDSPPGLLPERIGAVTDLMVDAHSQRSGVGRLLLTALRDWFTGKGIQQLIAYVPARFAVEQAFWRSQGAAEWMTILWLK
jgi:GNAT superfamily N-acetyltransferase